VRGIIPRWIPGGRRAAGGCGPTRWYARRWFRIAPPARHFEASRVPEEAPHFLPERGKSVIAA